MKKSKRKKDITQIKHLNKDRKNNPPSGLVNNKTEPLTVEKKKKYAFDSHLAPDLQFDIKRSEIEKIIDKGLSNCKEAKLALKKLKNMQEPYLNWAGKAERTSFEVPTLSLHTHEKIDSRAIIEQVRKTNSVNYEQLSIFQNERSIPKKRAINFYQHDKKWSNRLIAGDSLLVMNSLLEKEGMGGKVQCVYIDPPYGKQYGSNFQPFTNKKNVTDKKDEDLTSEPEMLKAFRDTWEFRIHSYLSYLRDRLLLARDLLTESGSCFVQISDENVHLVRNLMDEVFGRENFCKLIPFRKRQGRLSSSKLPEQTYDFLIWYCKEKYIKKTKILKIKFYNLFKEKSMEKLELFYDDEQGNRIPLTKAEKIDRNLLPVSIDKVYTRVPLELQTLNKDRKFPLQYNNKKWPAPPNGWSYPKEVLEKAIDFNRLTPKGKYLLFKRYYLESSKSKLISTWADTSGEQSAIYAVQTSIVPIQRCILMTTDPGDLVFDPTCGSGTTAYVAEKWGRRWITCDTSRVAVTLAKQRLMTAVFDYYKLKNKDEGISSGFEYKTAPHITLGSIANNEPTQEEVLYDQPFKDNKKARVTGPFTVEAVPSHIVQPLGQNKKPSFKYDWLDHVKKTGIRGKKGVTTDMHFARLEKLSGFKYLHAEGETKNPRGVVISFGPEHSPLDKRHVELALKEMNSKKEKPDILVFAAFHFDPEASKLINECKLEKTKVVQIQMNMDLQTSDLKKKTAKDSFWLIGSPDVEVKNRSGANKDAYVVEVRGWDYYNPASGKIESGGQNKIAMWVLDTDYNGRAVFPRQVFFPMAGKSDGWAKLAKSLKSEIDKDLIEKYKGTKSLPFKEGKNKKIAVKIIDDRGIESLIVFDFPK